MKFLSICSGIEAASLAFAPLGWLPLAFSEIEKFPSAALAHHHPDVPNLGDMTGWATWPAELLERADVLCGGTPCQAFSVAGARASLDDARGNLTLTFCEIADAIDAARAVRGREPAIIVWENVPGVLSTKDNAFGCFLGKLAGRDHQLEAPSGKWPRAGVVRGGRRRVAWCILDAQYFGVPQRRRRVWVVAVDETTVRRIGDRADPAKILAIGEGLRRDTPTRGKSRETAPTIPARSSAGGGLGTDFDCDGGLIVGTVCATLDASFGRLQGASGQDANHGHSHLIAYGGNNTAGPIDVATARNACGSGSGRMDFESETFVVAFDARQDCLSSSDTFGSLGCAEPQSQALAIHENQRAEITMSETCGAIKCADGKPGQGYPAALTHTGVRRITPVEAERLQGMPDGYTDIPWRGKPVAPDGHRYKAIGNSWAVPCARWVGARINEALFCP